LRKIWGVAKW